MDERIIEQLKLNFDIEETLSIEVSEELEMELQQLAEAHNMNLADYLGSRFVGHLERSFGG